MAPRPQQTLKTENPYFLIVSGWEGCVNMEHGSMAMWPCVKAIQRRCGLTLTHTSRCTITIVLCTPSEMFADDDEDNEDARLLGLINKPHVTEPTTLPEPADVRAFQAKLAGENKLSFNAVLAEPIGSYALGSEESRSAGWSECFRRRKKRRRRRRRPPRSERKIRRRRSVI